MRRVPQFEDAFQDIWKTEPARAPDREALDLYNSPVYGFIGRPLAQMSEFHLKQLAVTQQQAGMQQTALQQGRPSLSCSWPSIT